MEGLELGARRNILSHAAGGDAEDDGGGNKGTRADGGRDVDTGASLIISWRATRTKRGFAGAGGSCHPRITLTTARW